LRKRFKGEDVYGDNPGMMALGGGPMNEKYIKKRTPLQLACALGLFKIVEILLKKGARANGNHKEEFI
jgi:hypothetical protein